VRFQNTLLLWRADGGPLQERGLGVDPFCVSDVVGGKRVGSDLHSSRNSEYAVLAPLPACEKAVKLRLKSEGNGSRKAPVHTGLQA